MTRDWFNQICEEIKYQEKPIEISKNGHEPVSLRRLFKESFSCLVEERWIWDLYYRPLRMREFWDESRAEKYFYATTFSVFILKYSYGSDISTTSTRHLHRHTVLTCYLDSIVDMGWLSWAKQFGMAVFGLIPDIPPFDPNQPVGFRSSIEEDFPRLRLLAEGPHKMEIMKSLLEAAAVEKTRDSATSFQDIARYRMESNLVCIRPFIPAMGDLLQPLAMMYSFFDDAMDVIEDVDAGQPSYLTNNEDIRRGGNIARAAMSELNSLSKVDWSWLAQAAILLSEVNAMLQISLSINEYNNIENIGKHLFVRIAVLFFIILQ
ncbi:hypothetical protein TetV_220 [Tetraselmis virus 1]|uniref:Uncharacterized protein n=1 Tax=Tetraselmis virus 1 TaxID=2060617 RepID=A0A2P0VN22_9VIRU|nr:hypothetical protein QJ968_gp220 [Tetraselmis virus 1]AUF82312.1 hypothetical protein TetV_220 [Tetraselmis virus 1]